MRIRRFPARSNGTALPRARARNVPGTMNDTESRYASDVLLPRKISGEVLWFEFEPWKFHLGHRCWYEGDFGVMLADRSLEVHEVKAWWTNRGKAGIEDDARVKLQMVASRFPFMKFLVAAEERKRGVTQQWHYEEILTAGIAL